MRNEATEYKYAWFRPEQQRVISHLNGEIYTESGARNWGFVIATVCALTATALIIYFTPEIINIFSTVWEVLVSNN